MRATPRIERTFLTGLLALVIVVALAHARAFYFRGPLLPNDFVAFYCGGEAVLHHEDPYRIEPIFGCEKRVTENGRYLTFKPMPPYGTPVPLPPYDFIPLAVLALVPVEPAKALFGVLELAAMAMAAGAIRALARVPFAVAFGIALFGISYEAQPLGQLAPFAIAALAISAAAFRQDRIVPASIAVCIALVQPQFGAPAVLGAFLLYARARPTIAACVGLIALMSYLCGGLYRNAEYLHVLPLHARAEAGFTGQYSLTFVLHELGVATATALTLGSLSYVFMVCAGIVVLYNARGPARKNGAAVLLPAAFSVLGGTFIHSYQICAAVLLPLVLRFSSRTAPYAAMSIALLIFPWTIAIVPLSLSISCSIVLALIVAGSTIYYLQIATSKRRALTLAIGCVTALIVLYSSLYFTRPILPPTAAIASGGPPLPATSLGSIAWGKGIAFLDRAGPVAGTLPYDWFRWFVKLPSWIALLLLVPCAAYEVAASPSSPNSPVGSNRNERRLAP